MISNQARYYTVLNCAHNWLPLQVTTFEALTLTSCAALLTVVVEGGYRRKLSLMTAEV